jgi:hypothetical protein
MRQTSDFVKNFLPDVQNAYRHSIPVRRRKLLRLPHAFPPLIQRLLPALWCTKVPTALVNDSPGPVSYDAFHHSLIPEDLSQHLGSSRSREKPTRIGVQSLVNNSLPIRRLLCEYIGVLGILGGGNRRAICEHIAAALPGRHQDVFRERFTFFGIDRP